MHKAVELWTDGESGGYVRAKACGQGKCALEFNLTDVLVNIQSSKNALISACVGAKAHFASSDGACEICRKGERLRIIVQQWRGGKEEIELDRLDFEVALRGLADAEGPRISLL
jgi:hypothetical protein